jgi:hypothetical protein
MNVDNLLIQEQRSQIAIELKNNDYNLITLQMISTSTTLNQKDCATNPESHPDPLPRNNPD